MRSASPPRNWGGGWKEDGLPVFPLEISFLTFPFLCLFFCKSDETKMTIRGDCRSSVLWPPSRNVPAWFTEGSSWWKEENAFWNARTYGAFVYPLPRVGAGWCSHSALKYVPCASKYLSPTQRNPQLLAVWPGTENRDMSAEDLPHLCLPTAVWRVKVIVFSAQSSAFCLFASDFTLCSAYSAKGKLEWSIPPTSPRTQSSSGHGGHVMSRGQFWTLWSGVAWPPSNLPKPPRCHSGDIIVQSLPRTWYGIPFGVLVCASPFERRDMSKLPILTPNIRLLSTY